MTFLSDVFYLTKIRLEPFFLFFSPKLETIIISWIIRYAFCKPSKNQHIINFSKLSSNYKINSRNFPIKRDDVAYLLIIFQFVDCMEPHVRAQDAGGPTLVYHINAAYIKIFAEIYSNKI